ncbi:DUF3422 domain-containing protein [Klebsiella pneumoniae subsp. pneumoniae]|nr:DUF3422 domain-containing protein [Klebsiella pneumoniae subsp. pneumoniae]
MRAISLLRSWIDVELEHQNRDLLASMNNRARQQLHLQTVEGLSVAAISYYVVESDFVSGGRGFPGSTMSCHLNWRFAIPRALHCAPRFGGWCEEQELHTDPEHNENHSD